MRARFLQRRFHVVDHVEPRERLVRGRVLLRGVVRGRVDQDGTVATLELQTYVKSCMIPLSMKGREFNS